MPMATLVSTYFLKSILKSPYRTLNLGINISSRTKDFHTSTVRNSIWSMFTTSTRKAFQLRIKDKVPKHFTLIYKAPMETEMRFGYPVVLGTILTVPFVVLYKILTEGQINYRKEMYAIPFMNPQREIWIFSSALLLGGAAICAVIFKYPFRIYKHHQKNEYIGIFLSPIPGKLRPLHFKSATEVKFVNPLYRFFMPDCQYCLNTKKNVLLISYYFRTPADISEMLDPPDEF